LQRERRGYSTTISSQRSSPTTRALRELRDGPLSASELARRLGLPRTTIHHHLQILMQSGLVRVAVDDARWGNFELQPSAAEELGRLASSWVRAD
jgi:DNA-binding IclR family transcriptional regulator